MSTNLQPADRVTPQRRDELLTKIVNVIDRYGLYAPAAFFITLSKPVAFLGSQALFLASPIAGVFIKEELIEDYAQLMSDRDNVEILLNMLEERELEGRKKLQSQKAQRVPGEQKSIGDRLKGLLRKSK